MASSAEATDLWRQYRLPAQQQGTWRLGPLTLWIQHLPGEWRVAYEAGEDSDEPSRAAFEVGPLTDLQAKPTLRRFCFRSDFDTVTLKPGLPDRSVVVKPEKPLYVFAGEDVIFYMSFPLWVRVEIGEGRLLQEIPSVRLSDTWFGPSTREGELCYASRTFGRLHLKEIPERAHRAVTAVAIRNHADDPLYLERLNVRVPNLSLYRDEAGALWTEALTLERLEGQPLAALEIDRRAPRAAQNPQLLAEPRHHAHRNLLVRAFSSFLSVM